MSPSLDLAGLTGLDEGMAAGDRRSAVLQAYIRSPGFLIHGNATARYLALLAFLYREHPEAFEAVVQMRGRQRVYFAKSSEEIEAVSVNTFPQRIPGSPFWALTNSNLRQKQTILTRVLFALGYPEDVSQLVIVGLDGGIKQRVRA